jgi:hypothetical protein
MRTKLTSGRFVEAHLIQRTQDVVQNNPVLPGDKPATVASVLDAIERARHGLRPGYEISVDPDDAPNARDIAARWVRKPDGSFVGYMRGSSGPTTDDFAQWLDALRRRLLALASDGEQIAARLDSMEARLAALESAGACARAAC